MLSQAYVPELVRLAESSAVLKAPDRFDIVAAIREQLAESDLPASVHLRSDVSPKGAPDDPEAMLLCDLVAGARELAVVVREVELVAAHLARGRGVTVRQLARAAGISERAANDRYRRVVDRGSVDAAGSN